MGYKSKFTGEQIDALLDLVGEGGGNGSGSASTVEYLDLSGVDDQVKGAMVMFANALNLEITEGGMTGMKTAGMPYAFFALSMDTTFNLTWVKAVSIDFTAKAKQKMGDDEMDMTVGEMLPMMGLSQDIIDAIPRLTEEEFYNIG